MSKELKITGQDMARSTPHGAPFKLIDRVDAYHQEKRSLTGVKMVSQNERFLQGHFPDFPILPGVILIEALAQASGMLMSLDHWTRQGFAPEEALKKGLVGLAAFLAESRIKHVAGVYPGDLVTLESQVATQHGDLYVFKVCALVDGRECTKGQLTMTRALAAGA